MSYDSQHSWKDARKWEPFTSSLADGRKLEILNQNTKDWTDVPTYAGYGACLSLTRRSDGISGART